VEDTTLTIFDKIKMHGNEFISKLSGGSACHLNLTEHLTKKQYEIIVNDCAKKGCSYFTFNVPNTICNKCGHISKDYLNKCNMCGSEDLDYMTRIIGYLARISKFSEGRKIEAEKRFYHKLV
jgi:ribonucleoside-triphosphate reductase